MINNEISLVITDMDKTFLNDKSEISDRNMETVKWLKANNIKFAIATGRSKHSLEGFMKKYDLSEYVDYMINMNGVSLYDVHLKKSYNFGYVEENIIIELYKEFSKYDVAFAVHEGNTLICSKITRYTDIECEVNNYKAVEVQNFEKVINKPYPKLMLIGDKPILDYIHGELAKRKGMDFNFFKSYDFFLEIVKKDVSKGNALVKLCRMKGIDINGVAAFGDNLNDLDMIRYAGIGVAVSNAHEDIKLHARFITKSNEEDGFAYACEKLIRN